MDKHERAAMADIAAREQDAFLRQSSIKFLECAINLMATHLTMEEVAGLLEQHAKNLREWG